MQNAICGLAQCPLYILKLSQCGNNTMQPVNDLMIQEPNLSEPSLYENKGCTDSLQKMMVKPAKELK